MKIKIVCYVAALMMMPFSLCAQTADSAMLRAERFYAQSNYTQALAEYRSIADEGRVSPTLFYNMGNACFKNHDIKQAILYYERAKRLAPNDEDIDFNLNLSRSLIFDKVEPVPELFLITWGKVLRDLMTVRGWSRWSICTFVAVLIFGLVFLFVRNLRVRRLAFGFGVMCFALSVVCFGFGYMQRSNILRTDEAIVFAPSVTLKSSPDDSGNNLFILHEGIKVHIDDRISDWCEVRIADGNKGWMRISELEVI